MSLEQVKEFHEAFGHPVAEQVQLVDRPTFELRRRLIEEELKETIRDYHKGNFVKTVDGLADLLVVIHGSILVYGGFQGVSELKVYDYSEYDDPNSKPEMPSLEDFTTFSFFVFKAITEMSIANGSGNVYKVLTALLEMRSRVLEVFDDYSIPLEEIEAAVHKANMSKLGEDGKPIYRESDNKILKGPNFRPPEDDIREILREHGADV